MSGGQFLFVTIDVLQVPQLSVPMILESSNIWETYINGNNHVASEFSQLRYHGMVKYFRWEIHGKNASDHRECDVHTTIAPPELHVVLQTEYYTVFSIFCFVYSGVKVVVEGVNEVLLSNRTRGL